MKITSKKMFKRLLAGLMACVLAAVPITPSKASENEPTNYTVKFNDIANIFICNKEAATGPVTLTYTVESVTTSGANNGVVATKSPSLATPYSSGSMKYHPSINQMMQENGTYSITMDITSDTKKVQFSVSEGTTTPYLPYGAGEGSEESQYFGIYMAATTSAKLVNVTCVDSTGKDLGIRANNNSVLITNKDINYTTNLSFHDYNIVRVGSDTTLAGTKLGTTVTGQTNALTTAVDSLDGVLFTGKFTYSEVGHCVQEVRIGGHGADFGLGLSVFLASEGVIRFFNHYNNKYSDFSVAGAVTGQAIEIGVGFTRLNDTDWVMEYYVDGEVIGFSSCSLTNGHYFGNCIYFYPLDMTVASVERDNSIREQKAESYDLADGPYLVSGDSSVIDATGQEVLKTPSVNPTLTKPGDYTIETTVGSFKYRKEISLYQVGNVDMDTANQCNANDLNTLKKMLNASNKDYSVADAADYAADLNNDEKVGNKDLELLTDIVEGSKSLTDVVKKYHVPALTYDYLGGDTVMPIGGYYGPYSNGDNNFVDEKYYKLLADCGINLIDYSFNSMSESDWYVGLTELKYADKYGIGMYVDDFDMHLESERINGWKGNSQDIKYGSAEALTAQQVAEYYGRYSYFANCLGLHIVDEPFANAYYTSTSEQNRQLKYFDLASRTMNEYSNTSGFINLLPMNAKGYYPTGTTQVWDTEQDYRTFLKNYLADDCTKAKVLSFDKYPFSTAGDTLDSQKSYFAAINAVRDVSIDTEVPFWAYVGAGGDWRDTGDDDNTATVTTAVPTEGELYWNVNTMLTFGAKGIGYFPLIQPSYFANGQDKDPAGVDRNGLIDAEKNTTVFYDYATKMNKQIKAVDEVLMKSNSKAIVATGTTTVQTLQDAGVTVQTSYGPLSSVAVTKDKTDNYGAIVGCFEYGDKEAYYAVNYDTEDTATLTLNFDNNYTYRYVVNATEYISSGEQVEVEVGAGESVLVVVENINVSFQTVQAKITDSIALTYKVQLAGDIPAGMLPTMTFEMNGTVTEPVEGYLVEGTKDVWVFTCSEIRAQRMGDTITATVQVGDIGVANEYSVLSYCKDVLAMSATDLGLTKAKKDALDSMVVNLVKYAAAVQVYNGEADTLTSQLTSEQLALGTQGGSLDNLEGVVATKLEGTVDADYTWKSASVILKDKTNIRCKFTATDISNLVVKITINGDVIFKDADDFVSAGKQNEYYLYFDNIYAYEYGKKITFTFINDDVPVGQVLNYSVNTYLDAKKAVSDTKLVSLLDAINNYGNAALDYVRAESNQKPETDLPEDEL